MIQQSVKRLQQQENTLCNQIQEPVNLRQDILSYLIQIYADMGWLILNVLQINNLQIEATAH